MISPAPYYRVRTQPLLGHSGYWLTDKAAFVKLISEGLPGRLMPGNGTLTKKEIDDLYNYMRDCFSKK
jgi:cytochrome c1